MTAPHYSDVWRGIAERDPGRTAVVTRDTAWTYGRLAAEADAIASFLTAGGLVPLDAAALLLHNLPEYLAINWGCLATGVAPVAINYRYRAGEVRDLLLDSDSKLLFAPTSLGQVAAEAAAGLDIELVTIDDGGAPVPGATRYEDVVAAGGALPPIAPRGADMRIYTGGTTGSPKAVVWELDTLLEARRHSTWGIIGVTPPDSVEAAVAIATDPATARVTTLPLSPMLHGTASSTTMGTLAVGGTVVLHASPRMDIDEAYRLAMEHRATRLIVAGDALALPLVERAERGEGLPHVTSILSSGMRFSDDVKRRLHALGNLSIIDILASSEGGPYAFGTTTGIHDLPARLVLQPGSVLLDDEQQEITLEPGALGKLAFRGILPKGYYGDPEKTAAAFPTIRGQRYVIPGDWARANGDGTIELLGRLSAVVNTGGEKVFPAEVENALLAHPAVDDAVVFGLPHERFGEVVCAMVAPAEGTELDAEALREFVGERLAGYKKPRHVFVRPSLERTLTGKVELARVKDDALRELARPMGAAQ